MQIPKYLGEQVELTVVLKDEETIQIAIVVGGYAEDRTFLGKFRDTTRLFGHESCCVP